jgi:hypothetical protein
MDIKLRNWLLNKRKKYLAHDLSGKEEKIKTEKPF